MARIVIIGSAHPLRGGLSNFNHRLCRQYQEEGHDCRIYSYSLQYPSILFPGTTQYTTDPAPDNIKIHTVINTINPFNWIATGNELKKFRPDIIIVRYWIPFLGPSLGTILRRVKKNRHTRVIALLDNVIPHEKRPGDHVFTKWFLKACDAFITLSSQVTHDLRLFEKDKPSVELLHPLFDSMGEPVSRSSARQYLNIDPDIGILLFFGYIRPYKGLDILFEAVKRIREQHNTITPFKILVAGEYYEDEKPYLEQIKRLGIEDNLILKTHFIKDSEVKYYLCAADGVIQPYRDATQSGVTPLAYHFEKPMIVTNVGSLPAFVPDGKAGLVCEPNPESMSEAIVRYFQLGEDYFIPHLREEKKRYSWQQFAGEILTLAEQIRL